MVRLSAALALTALITLMGELVLTRVFDVILTANMSYMVITCAMFGFGMAGVYAAIRPLPSGHDARRLLAGLSVGVALCLVVFRPVVNRLPFDYRQIGESPLLEIALFAGIYLALLTPFFLLGLIFTSVFSLHPDRIRTLYFWDLCGAALGAVLLVPLIPPIGPGGVLWFAAGLALVAAALFSPSRGLSWAAVAAGVVAVAVPFLHAPAYLDFRLYGAKSWVAAAGDAGEIEVTRWDPISKIEVLARPDRKRVAYDGGSQLSFIFPFDGDFEALRRDYAEDVESKFWGWKVLAAHYLKRDTGARVLVIGGGAGQEAKAALMFGAGRVDVVELVGAVVDLVENRYADYAGHLYDHPDLTVTVGEGRSVLRASDARYDVIQIYSNHTSSSIASGTGAMATTYLQTAEAYREYFDHLTENGVLQINHPLYPRMVTTAALAWRDMGRSDLRRHVVVFGNDSTFQPTFLLKMQPWTREEIDDLSAFFRASGDESDRMLEDPLHPERSMLDDVFYAGDPAALAGVEDVVDYRVSPTTDDRPYFRFWRKHLGVVEADPARFLDPSTAGMLNSQLMLGVPMDVVHLFVTAVVSIGFVGLFLLLPLWFSEVGRTRWPARGSSMTYFACLGAGFILFELVLIQIFMQFIGSPLHAYSVVVFAMLLAAGIGSFASQALGIDLDRRWQWPFAGVMATAAALVALYPLVFDAWIGLPLQGRIAVATAMILPLGFFLGMPFPLGILRIEHEPRGAIAWAWALNGLFTVLGGLASIGLSIVFGFRATLLVAIAIYALAFALFAHSRSRRAAPAPPEPA